MFCTQEEVTNFEAACGADQDAFSRYFWGMLEGGVYVAPSVFEAAFVSTVHSGADIEQTIEAHGKALAKV